MQPVHPFPSVIVGIKNPHQLRLTGHHNRLTMSCLRDSPIYFFRNLLCQNVCKRQTFLSLMICLHFTTLYYHNVSLRLLLSISATSFLQQQNVMFCVYVGGWMKQKAEKSEHSLLMIFHFFSFNFFSCSLQKIFV